MVNWEQLIDLLQPVFISEQHWAFEKIGEIFRQIHVHVAGH
jgi:hypothetical protein